jgi:plasmid stabilization system protein ParE
MSFGRRDWRSFDERSPSAWSKRSEARPGPSIRKISNAASESDLPKQLPRRQHHRLFYRATENGILALRVLHGASDIDNIFNP